MKINELANKSGISAYTIRYYEKEGLLDGRQIKREANNYRDYTEEAIDRLRLIKKFQGIGCSLLELKEIMHDKDNKVRTNEDVIKWIRSKIRDTESKKKEYDQMLETLNSMLAYRMGIKEH